MEKPIRGDIVVVPFPFSNLKESKKRPALILSSLDGEDVVILQITSQNKSKKYTVNITKNDFKQGGLSIDSFVRCDRIYTIDRNVILYKVGSLNDLKFNIIKNKVIDSLELK
jgi:mRNA interferase MazF